MLQNINLDKATVSAELHGNMYHALYGVSGVLSWGNKMGYEIVSNNLIKIKDGVAINQGRFTRIPHGSVEEVRIENGTSGVNRIDLIVIRFNSNGGSETQTIKVLKGQNNGAQPQIITSDLYNGGNTNDLPLYKVQINGLNITSVTPMFKSLQPLYGLVKQYYSKEEIDSKLGTYLSESTANSRYATKSHLHNNFTGARSDSSGVSGYVPAPSYGDTNSFLRSDGLWTKIPSNTLTVDSYLNSYSNNPIANKAVYEAMQGKANSSHSHSGYASYNHNHDSAYYTQSQISNLLAYKADANKLGGLSFQALSQSDYDRISYKDQNTIYFIYE